MQQRPVFGRKKPAHDVETRRVEMPQGARAFDHELFSGGIGDMLRQHGFHPDEPFNIMTLQQPVAAQLVEGEANLRTITDFFAEKAGVRLGVSYFMPVELWRGPLGPALVQRLGLLPHRSWNALFLPADAVSAERLGLPLGAPQHGAEGVEKSATLAEMILELWQGKTSPEADAIAIMCDALAKNLPAIFPPERADMRPETAQARHRLRIAAGMLAITDLGIEPEVIEASHRHFMEDPARQLVAL